MSALESTRAHLDLIVRKRDRLQQAALEALDVLVELVGRETLTPSEAVEVWQWARTLGVPHASERVADATGYGLSHVSQWARTCPPEGGRTIAGDFPVGYSALPMRGVPTVYALFDLTGEVVYIGQSMVIRQRLGQHWNDRVSKPGLARWWVMVCSDRDDMRRREAELIREHQPTFNKAGL